MDGRKMIFCKKVNSTHTRAAGHDDSGGGTISISGANAGMLGSYFAIDNSFGAAGGRSAAG